MMVLPPCMACTVNWRRSSLEAEQSLRRCAGGIVPKTQGFNLRNRGEPCDEELFRQEVRNSLPEAALLRMQPELHAEDWNVLIRTCYELNSANGVAIVMKAQVAMVLRQVGYTRNSVAMITTQSPSQLYLYPSQEIFAHRFLTQFGAKPCRHSHEEFPETMLKLGSTITGRKTGQVAAAVAAGPLMGEPLQV